MRSMAEERVHRRLAAILVADVVGFSRLMEADEAGTFAALKERRKAIVEPLVKVHSGRIVKVMGDGVLIEFASAVNAVKAAVELQVKFAEANEALPESHRIVLRIGINLGDVIGEGADIYGEGVNVAARLEALAQPGGVCLSAKVYEEVRGKVTVAFEDLGNQSLKNIGAPIRVFRIPRSTPAAAKAPTSVPAKPSIAVLPFTNMSGDPEQQYFSDGITEDIITAISRFRSLFVIARNSSFAFREKAMTVAEIAERLGVRYVLEGSVRKTGNRVRITAQLIEAGSDNHVWSERYDRELEDIFAVQEEVATIIASTLSGQVETDVANRATRNSPDTFAAYDFALRGVQYHQRSTREDVARAAELFGKALELDPNYAEAHAWLSLCHTAKWFYDLDRRALETAIGLASRAVELDAQNARCHVILGYALLYARNFDSAEFHHFRAITLNPNDTHILTHLGLFLAYAGRPSESAEWFAKGLQLNPLPPSWYAEYRGIVAYVEGRYDEAVKALVGHTDLVSDLMYIVAALGQLDRRQEALRYIEMARTLKPDKSLFDYANAEPFKMPEAVEHLREGLRKAGLPE